MFIILRLIIVTNLLFRDPPPPPPPSPPTTPERARQEARAEDRLGRLQMTDPDDRRDRMILAIPPQIDGARMAALIAMTVLPEGWNRPLRHLLPGRQAPQISLGVIQPTAGPSNVTRPILDNIPQTVVPDNWNRPLENPIDQLRTVLANAPPLPTIARRGRGRGRGVPVVSVYDENQRARMMELELNIRNERLQAEMDENIRIERERLLAEEQQQEMRRRVEELRQAQEEEQLRRIMEERERLNQEAIRAEEVERELRENQERLAQEAIRAEELEGQLREDQRRENMENGEQQLGMLLQQWREEHEADMAEDNDDDFFGQIDDDLDERELAALRMLEAQAPAIQPHLGGNLDLDINDPRDQEEFHLHNTPPPLPPPRRLNIPKACRPYLEPLEVHFLGGMNVECRNCRALHFMSERLTSSSQTNPKFGVCCLQGQIALPPYRPMPNELENLLCGISPQSQTFKGNIRSYNSALAFTSLGAKIDQSVTRSSGPYCFKICGKLCHLSGALLPTEGETPLYAQIYIHDPEQQLNYRTRNNQTTCNSVVMGELQDMLHRHNPYVGAYQQAFEIMNGKPEHEHHTVYAKLRVEPGNDIQVYNAPTANEISVIVPEAGDADVSDHRDIVLRLQGGRLQRISNLSCSYSPLHYVLLFPYGDSGWHINIAAQPGAGNNQRSRNVT